MGMDPGYTDEAPPGQEHQEEAAKPHDPSPVGPTNLTWKERKAQQRSPLWWTAPQKAPPRQQLTVPSVHQLLTDIYVILGGTIDRLRQFEQPEGNRQLDPRDQLALYRATHIKSTAMLQMVKVVGIMEEIQARRSARTIKGKPIEELSDYEVLEHMASSPDGLPPHMRELMAQLIEQRQRIAGAEAAAAKQLGEPGEQAAIPDKGPRKRHKARPKAPSSFSQAIAVETLPNMVRKELDVGAEDEGESTS